MQRTIVHHATQQPTTGRDVGRTPAERQSDEEIERELGTVLREHWRGDAPLNANRVWHIVSEQIGDTEQQPRRGAPRLTLPLARIATAIMSARRRALALSATFTIIGLIAITAGGATTTPADATASPPPSSPDSSVPRRLTDTATTAHNVNREVDALATFAAVAIEDGTLSPDEHVSIQQRAARIAAALDDHDVAGPDLTTTDIRSAALTVAAAAEQLAQHRQPDPTPVHASLAALETLAANIDRASASAPLSQPDSADPQRSPTAEPPPSPNAQQTPLPAPKSDPTAQPAEAPEAREEPVDLGPEPTPVWPPPNEQTTPPAPARSDPPAPAPANPPANGTPATPDHPHGPDDAAATPDHPRGPDGATLDKSGPSHGPSASPAPPEQSTTTVTPTESASPPADPPTESPSTDLNPPPHEQPERPRDSGPHSNDNRANNGPGNSGRDNSANHGPSAPERTN